VAVARQGRVPAHAQAESLPLTSQPPAPRAKAPRSFEWPVSGPVTNAMTAKHPLGIDIGLAAEPNAPILASATGYVVYAGGPSCCGYGLHVILDHGNGVQTVYAHLSRIDVWEGQLVYQRTQIGLAGNTGHSRGAHLHFEIRYGERRLDPIEHLAPACETPDSVYPLYAVLEGDCALAPGSRYQRSLDTALR